jgi:spectinomycin phosphotransferase
LTVKAIPDDLDERALLEELTAGWDISASRVEYAPLGFGSYHWTIVDGRGRHWFVTVDDLGRDDSPDARDRELAGIRDAFRTAVALREEADLEFVLAPVPSKRGETARRLAPRYSVAVFPFVEGESQPFETVISAETAAAATVILSRLHRVPPPERVPRHDIALAGRSVIESSLNDLDEPWRSGPYAARAQDWVARNAPALRRKLEAFDGLVARVAVTPDDLVVTHGEPHPANFMRTDDGLLLIDWDTVALARPERDLWFVARESDAVLDRYIAMTGRQPSRDALALYRLRWKLDDISIFLGDFRAEHGEDEDSAESWRLLIGYATPAATT